MRASPFKVLVTTVFTTARCFEILIERLPWRIGILSCNSSERSVRRFFVPRGRPFGFPETPRLNCVCRGGLRYPTSYLDPSSSAMMLFRLRFKLAKRLSG